MFQDDLNQTCHFKPNGLNLKIRKIFYNGIQKFKYHQEYFKWINNNISRKPKPNLKWLKPNDLNLKIRKIFYNSIQKYKFHKNISKKSYRARGSVFTKTMKPASLPTLDKPSGYSTPPGNLACRNPSTTPCPVAIIGARTTRFVDLRPITPQLISQKMKQVCSGRKPPKNVSHVIKTRTASRRLST